MSEEQIQYLPFHAINEYLLPDFRQQVLQTVLSRQNELDGPARGVIQSTFRKEVQIPGFRDSARAPLPMKVRNAISVFQRNPEFAGAVLTAWAGLQAELRQQVHDLLTERGWDLLPADADRAEVPGFRTEWPSEDSFTVLDESFRAANPESTATDDDINLMVTWLGGRLPSYLNEEEDESAAPEEDAS